MAEGTTYLASTLALAGTLSRELPAWRDREDEAYRVIEICQVLTNQAYQELGEDYRRGTWPKADESVISALQGALADHHHGPCGEFLAHVLVRYGARDAKLILVNGAPLEAMSTHKRRFYFDQTGFLSNKFGIAHTPAVVEQAGKVMRITEFAVSKASSR